MTIAKERRILANELEKMLNQSIPHIQQTYELLKERLENIHEEIENTSKESEEYKKIERYHTELMQLDLALYSLEKEVRESKDNIQYVKNEIEKKASREIDRYEFIDVVIESAKNKEVYQDILKYSFEKLNVLIENPSKEFENKLAESLSIMSIQELNELAEKYELEYEVIDIE